MIFFCEILHAFGFSDLVDLWVIKIKSPRSFAHVVRQDHVAQSTKRRSREPGVYSQNNKILCSLNTADKCNLLCGHFWLIVFFLGVCVFIGGSGGLRSHGYT